MTRVRTRAGALLAAVAVAMAGAAWVGADVADAAASPRTAGEPVEASVTPNVGRTGSKVVAAGSGWAPNARIQLTTCGDLGIGGSSACDLGTTFTTIVRDDGTFATAVSFGDPPQPCPCVVHVNDASSTSTVDIPITLRGHAKGKPPTPTASDVSPVQVTGVSVDGWGPVSAWFGAGAHRTLDITVRNPRSLPAVGTIVTVSDGDQPGDVLATRKLDVLAPGQTRTEQIEVVFPAGLGGKHTLRVNVDGQDAPEPVVVTAWAWGFFLIIGALLVLAVVVAVRRWRNRQRPSSAPGRHGQSRERQPA